MESVKVGAVALRNGVVERSDTRMSSQNMPDPIRCSADPTHPNTFSCEPVVIGPKPSAGSTGAGSPTGSAQPNSPAVTALVDRFPQRAALEDPRVAAFTTETAERCAGKLLAFALSVSKLGDTAAVALGFAKADY